MNPIRRQLLTAAVGVTANSLPLRAIAQAEPGFDELFAEAQKHPEQFEAIRSLRDFPDVFGSKAVAPRVKPATRKVAPKAVQMVVLLEVSSEQRYKAKYKQPVWPGGASGITFGIGYDAGHMRKAWLKTDWAGFLDPSALALLEPACGVTGTAAKALVSKLASISVEWTEAMSQFESRLLPLYIGATLQAVPLAAKLSDKSLGALVSLVYNRGASFGKTGDRYTEMRAIKAALAAGNYKSIPLQIRKMKRLWKVEEFPGLHARRDLEAALFQEGLV